MQELFVDKIHFFKFLCMRDKPRLPQLNIISSSPSSSVQASLTAWIFSSVRGNTIKEGEIPYVENKLLHSLTYISQIFVPNLRKWSKPRYLKAEVLWVPQKVRAMLVRYLLSGIHIIVYSCTDCGTSKIYLCLEKNRSSFSRVSLKSETKDMHP